MMRYFKQAWNLIRQEKLFSSIYIVGTGLSISVVMLLSIIYYVRIANIYPETNRDRMLIVKSGVEKQKSNRYESSSSLSLSFIDACIRPAKGIEAMTAICNSSSENMVQPPGSKGQVEVEVKYIDADFWKVFSFRFRDGKPFSEADFQSGIHTAVISESLAKRLFGRTAVAGEYFSLNFEPYRISGVVKDASYVTTVTFADIWLPYTVLHDYAESFGLSGALGQQFVSVPLEGTSVVFTPAMLLNLPIFGISLGVCFLLNLLTSAIPAWRASHREIVYSLNTK